MESGLHLAAWGEGMERLTGLDPGEGNGSSSCMDRLDVVQKGLRGAPGLLLDSDLLIVSSYRGS